jgi:environmental stress-induced protein Ves
MRILRAANYRDMPWKNGMGFTTEIAISPGAASLDDFDWRISMAHVAADGPFSRFPGIDRTLLLLEGNGMILAGHHHDPVCLERNSDPYAFRGDVTTDAMLVSGPILDLNIMSRRETYQHSASRLDLKRPHIFPASTALRVIFVERGAATIQAGPTTDLLRQHDTAILGASCTAVEIEPQPFVKLVAISFAQPAKGIRFGAGQLVL